MFIFLQKIVNVKYSFLEIL